MVYASDGYSFKCFPFQEIGYVSLNITPTLVQHGARNVLADHAWTQVVGSESECRSRVRKFESQLGHITFLEINHVVSTVILHLQLIKKMSVTGENMCTRVLINRLED